MNRLLPTLALCFATVATATAECSLAGMTLSGTVADQVGVYDANGKFIAEIGREQLVMGSELLGCDESYGLVKVRLVSGEEQWLDRAELKISVDGQQAPRRICVQTASSRAADHTEPAVAGIDPKAPQDCVAPAPPAPKTR
ncbi:MAG: hypothetical protein KJ041_06215 [Gammaproteobacteria bacterium]|nr:hypothetical protein [Gammaproteobacteria bacterium]